MVEWNVLMDMESIDLLLEAAKYIGDFAVTRSDSQEQNVRSSLSVVTSDVATIPHKSKEPAYLQPAGRSSINETTVSFSGVISSTPLLPQCSADPQNYQPLDLSWAMTEDVPLDCSCIHVEDNRALNLVVEKKQTGEGLESLPARRYGPLNFVCRDKRTSEHPAVEAPSAVHQSCSEDFVQAKRFKASEHRGEHQAGEAKDDEEWNQDSDYDDDDDDKDKDYLPDNTNLNDLSIFEYFEPYANQSDNEPEDDYGFADLEHNDTEGAHRNLVNKVNNKQLKEKGLQYVRRNGTIVPARSVRAPCCCTKRRCYEKFTDDIRKKLLTNLLSLRMSGQNQFLSSHVEVGYVQRHRVGIVCEILLVTVIIGLRQK